MTDTTPRLGLTEMQASQASKHVTFNDGLIQLDALVSLYFLAMNQNTPPGSPSDGDTYQTGGSPTGAWSGYSGKIAYCLDGSWRFYTPFNGLIAFNAADSKIYVYQSGTWNAVSSGGGGSGLPKNYLTGLLLSNNATTPNTKIDVSTGAARDDSDTVDLKPTAGTINCGGTGANGLDAGTLASNTWYHAFAIAKADGTEAFLASTSLSAPTMPTGYIYKRRLGSFKTDGSSHILAFSQNGDEFLWSIVPQDINTSSQGTTANLYGLTVPTGLKVTALLRGIAAGSSSIVTVLINSPDEASVAANALTGNCTVQSQSAGAGISFVTTCRTNTAGQVRAISNVASTTIFLATYGWIDMRGK